MNPVKFYELETDDEEEADLQGEEEGADGQGEEVNSNLNNI